VKKALILDSSLSIDKVIDSLPELTS
jgi:hypothetical protein